MKTEEIRRDRPEEIRRSTEARRDQKRPEETVRERKRQEETRRDQKGPEARFVAARRFPVGRLILAGCTVLLLGHGTQCNYCSGRGCVGIESKSGAWPSTRATYAAGFRGQCITFWLQDFLVVFGVGWAWFGVVWFLG